MNKLKHISLILLIPLLVLSCKDEEFTMQRQPYSGNELRVDGYYYKYYYSNDGIWYTIVHFFYRNGIYLSAMAYSGTDLSVVEQEMLERYDIIRNDKIGWGVFNIYDNKMNVEVWSTSVGGGLPVFRWHALIENDTTFKVEYSGEVYHFRQFSPKPDSTNKWIK
jgi:hypothetical protein